MLPSNGARILLDSKLQTFKKNSLYFIQKLKQFDWIRCFWVFHNEPINCSLFIWMGHCWIFLGRRKAQVWKWLYDRWDNLCMRIHSLARCKPAPCSWQLALTGAPQLLLSCSPAGPGSHLDFLTSRRWWFQGQCDTANHPQKVTI